MSDNMALSILPDTVLQPLSMQFSISTTHSKWKMIHKTYSERETPDNVFNWSLTQWTNHLTALIQKAAFREHCWPLQSDPRNASIQLERTQIAWLFLAPWLFHTQYCMWLCSFPTGHCRGSPSQTANHMCRLGLRQPVAQHPFIALMCE